MKRGKIESVDKDNNPMRILDLVFLEFVDAI